MSKSSVALTAEASVVRKADLDTPSSPTASDSRLQRIRAVLSDYGQLAKPGIIFGNLVSVAGGFFFAAGWDFTLSLLLSVFIGVSLVIASGCAVNNVIDRDIDSIMKRTQSRLLVRGGVSPKLVLTAAVLVGIAGTILLAVGANLLSAELAVLGFAVYVGVYTLGLKRRSAWSTVVGSISGAIPPVIGYCAVTGTFDWCAALLLLVFCVWQMPHSYAIGILYHDDYKAAGVPVLPVRHGIHAAKVQILLYIPVFVVSAALMTVVGYTGLGFMVVMLILGGYWSYLGVMGFSSTDDRAWARKMFLFSLIIIMVLSLMIGCSHVG